MGNGQAVAADILQRLNEADRSLAWLARQIDQPYKRVVAEVKHGRRLSLEVAVGAAAALEVDLGELVSNAASEKAVA
jgi:hypothetical protein